MIRCGLHDFTITNEASSLERTRKQLEARNSSNPLQHGSVVSTARRSDRNISEMRLFRGRQAAREMEEDGVRGTREKYAEGGAEEKATSLEQGRERPRGCVRVAQPPESIATTHPWRIFAPGDRRL